MYDSRNSVNYIANEELEEKVIVSRNTSNENDTGVILTLSNQNDYTELNISETTVNTKTSANPSTLRVGSKGAKVKELQKNLTKLGYKTKGTDGIFGKNTQSAVLAFQKAYGLKADGIVGSQTQNAITKALDYQKKGILTIGSRGAKVKELQKNLTKLGYNTKGSDGIFGNDTKKAVLAFQKAKGLTQDGIVGNATQKAIQKALKANNSSQTSETGEKPSQNSKAIQKMLDNLKNDTSLGLSKEKRTAMVMAAERLLHDKYEPEFVAGVLGNIQNEGTAGKFESSNYKTNPSKEPSYLKYMDSHCNYRNMFSGKSIRDVGISAAINLQKSAKASGYKGKFGLGMIQWTGSRTEGLLKSYQKYAKGDKPTMEECIKAEVNYMADELKGEFSGVYASWKSGNKTAGSAGEIVCKKYEKPGNMEVEAKNRASNASKIYRVMMK